MAEQEDIRQVAISHHHQEVGLFKNWYADLASSRFANAFTYGRAKIDAMVDDLFRAAPKGGKILDVGCGTGEHLKRALSHGLGAYGVEPAPAMLETARREVPQGTIEQGVATKLPFPDGTFDVVIMIEVLRYLHRSDVREALGEALRVLRPGGKLLVTLVNRWSLDGFYLLHRGRQLLSGRKYNERHPFCLFFTPGEAEREFRNGGFVNVRSEGRLLGPIRMAYKVNERFGAKVAEVLEGVDDRLNGSKLARPFAGHLIVVGEAPAARAAAKPRGRRKSSK